MKTPQTYPPNLSKLRVSRTFDAPRERVLPGLEPTRRN